MIGPPAFLMPPVQRLVVSAQHRKQVAAIAVQRRLVGPQIGRGAIVFQRFLRPSQAEHDVAAVDVRFGRGGIERNRAIETGQRFVGPPLGDQALAQIDMDEDNRAIDGDGRPDQSDPSTVLPRWSWITPSMCMASKCAELRARISR